jgi:uncharacterized MAPEG superfamily protein
MTIELQALYVVAAILLVLLSVQGMLAPITHGLKWGLGPRDEPRTPSILQGRMNRIVANHLEGMAMFIPLILIADLADVSTPLTQWGAVIYAGGRAAFAVVYLVGVPVLRSATWGAAMVGLLAIGYELLRTGF